MEANIPKEALLINEGNIIILVEVYIKVLSNVFVSQYFDID